MRTNYPTRDIGREVDYEVIKRRGYLDQGIIVAKIDDPRLSAFDRQYLKNIGDKLYGNAR
jgi:hypothetical protein